VNAPHTREGVELNQRLLSAELAALRRILERRSGKDEAAAGGADDGGTGGTAPLLDRVQAIFGLSPFERSVLLLCAAMELDGRFGALCAAAHGDARRSYPTFSLALAALPDAHWSALTPEAPLRRWQLIDVLPGDTLTLSALRIDERVLHHLVGVPYVDVRIRDLLRPLPPAGELPPSHRLAAARIADLWTGAVAPAIGLWGPESAAKRAILAAACAALGCTALVLRGADLPANAAERRALLHLTQREALLSNAIAVLEDEEPAGAAAPGALEAISGPLVLLAREPRRGLGRPVLGIRVDKPSVAEQRELWRSALGAARAPAEESLDALTGQFNLDAGSIGAAALDAALAAPVREGAAPQREALWGAARRQAAPRLDDLAQRVVPAAGWDDLVLPDEQKRILRDIVASLRQRYKVFETWGLGRAGKRGLGLSTLFAGQSGTGKTLAAEVIARALELDLYCIDLSSVVSKYIGETEKNLRRVFDAAEEGGAVLLFDEADALFGKRSEVRDSHDRYANIEVSYLLQRMDSYRGLAILTTNMKGALDPAFLRRLRFIVQFPFPDAAQRAEIWRRAYPGGTPTEALDLGKLARLNIAGGNIRNVALNAAFLAAEAGEPVRMSHLLRAARSEYAKLDRALGEAEIGGWA
jgi:AAA+ superfamily predicted ATPase